MPNNIPTQPISSSDPIVIPEGKTEAERGEEDAVLMRTINLPAATFERAGTKVQAKLIIIDKYSSENARSDAAAEADGE